MKKIHFMSTPEQSGSTEAGSEASWANETLPLPVRQELLQRELDEIIRRKRQAQPSAAGAPHTERPGTGSHPA